MPLNASLTVEAGRRGRQLLGQTRRPSARGLEQRGLGSAGIYRLRLRTADALSLINRTVWLVPRTTTCITPEIEYSLL